MSRILVNDDNQGTLCDLHCFFPTRVMPSNLRSKKRALVVARLPLVDMTDLWNSIAGLGWLCIGFSLEGRSARENRAFRGRFKRSQPLNTNSSETEMNDSRTAFSGGLHFEEF